WHAGPGGDRGGAGRPRRTAPAAGGGGRHRAGVLREPGPGGPPASPRLARGARGRRGARRGWWRAERGVPRGRARRPGCGLHRAAAPGRARRAHPRRGRGALAQGGAPRRRRDDATGRRGLRDGGGRGARALMFTGIIEQMGTVTALEGRADGARLQVATGLASECDVGASVAVNGACLTVVARTGEGLAFDLGPETLRSTALGELGPGRPVNLERPLRLGGPLGGHLVLGGVGGVGAITGIGRGAAARSGGALPASEVEAPVILQ